MVNYKNLLLVRQTNQAQSRFLSSPVLFIQPVSCLRDSARPCEEEGTWIIWFPFNVSYRSDFSFIGHHLKDHFSHYKTLVFVEQWHEDFKGGTSWEFCGSWNHTFPCLHAGRSSCSFFLLTLPYGAAIGCTAKITWMGVGRNNGIPECSRRWYMGECWPKLWVCLCTLQQGVFLPLFLPCWASIGY